MKKNHKKKIAAVAGVFALAVLMLSSSRSYCQIAKGQSKFIGNVIGTYIPSDFAKYWDQVTPENAGKWGNVAVSENPARWDWAPLDSIYNYSLSHGFPFKFHNLIWGNQQPTWINSLSPARQKKIAEIWIKDCGKRYPRSAMVDVVNEPIQHPPSYKNALGGDGSTGRRCSPFLIRRQVATLRLCSARVRAKACPPLPSATK